MLNASRRHRDRRHGHAPRRGPILGDHADGVAPEDASRCSGAPPRAARRRCSTPPRPRDDRRDGAALARAARRGSARPTCPTAALPWGRSAEIEVGDGYARCLRVSFVGELGYELYPTADLAVSLYDAVARRRRRPRATPRRLPRARLAPLREGLPPPRPRHRPGRRPVPGRSRLHRRARQARRLHRPRRDRGARRTRRRIAGRCSCGCDDPEPLLLHGESLLLRRRDRRPR